MHTEISFPNLGIYLKNVGKSIDLFGIEIAYYGIIIGTAILLGFWIAAREAKRTGQNPENYLDMGIIGVIAGIVGDDGISATWHYKCSIYGGAGKHLSDCVCLCDAVGTALPFI